MPRALAFYLPQFHPIPENDEWWGPGFTEWINVTKAKPLFPGHSQPHVPTELGYYDLRVPEVREAQAALAAAHGIHGFVYYHYWFQGRRLLERPFEEVLASGTPDFPFALCWANEEWTRNWDAQTGELLMAQEYSDADHLAHIRWLCTAFADDRYIKIDGRPLMLIYRAELIPDLPRIAEIWRTEAQRQGFPDLYLCWVESHGPPPRGPQAFGLDATVGFMPLDRERVRVFAPDEAFRGHRIIDYRSSADAELQRPAPSWKRFPSVMVGWDNTARRRHGATIFEGATPAAYEDWLRRTVEATSGVREEENYLFLLAWNEWAEGNHLEPDEHWGRGFLEATRSVLSGRPVTTSEPPTGPAVGGGRHHHLLRGGDPSSSHQGPHANAVDLIEDLRPGRGNELVDLGAGRGSIGLELSGRGFSYHGFEIDDASLEAMRAAGIPATRCDLADVAGLETELDEIGGVGAFLLLGVLEHLADPEALLSGLSTWSLKHGEPSLVVAVPNATHFDAGLGLLCDRPGPSEEGHRELPVLRQFSERSLLGLLRRSGWSVAARNDFSVLRSERYDTDLNDGLPPEMVGALHVLAEACNPNSAVHSFVWRLEPVAVTTPPAEGENPPERAAEDDDAERAERAAKAVRSYLVSVGLVTSETNRRAAKQLKFGMGPRWKRVVTTRIERSRWMTVAYWKIRRWLP